MKDQIFSELRTFLSVADYSFCHELGQIGLLTVQDWSKRLHIQPRCNFQIINPLLVISVLTVIQILKWVNKIF